jgi:nicotinate phosphoribosyltransferase
VTRVAGALITDLYELNMAASFLRRSMNKLATFSLFVRQLPANRGFLVAAGLESALEGLEQYRFDDDDLEYVGELGFDDAALQAFARLRFTGEVWAVPEGRIVLANEPLLEVTAPIAEAQLVETFLLNQMTFQTVLATKAARCRLAADGKMDLVEFGFRRTQGIEAGIAAARLSVMVGFVGTSNVKASRLYGLHPMGTMAHSYIEAFPSEREAFRAFAQDLPAQTTFLVDTYDTIAGVEHAIEVIHELGLEETAGVRLDSGDLDALARRTRKVLDDAGLPHVRIFVSGGLDEHEVARMVTAGVPADAAGIGTRLGVSADAPYLDTAYKLVAYDDHPVAKLSTGKATLPGAKQVFRSPGLTDVIGIRTEEPPPGAAPLLEWVMVDGRQLDRPQSPVAALSRAKARFERDLVEIPPTALDLRHPEAPVPSLSPALRQLTEGVQEELRLREQGAR